MRIELSLAHPGLVEFKPETVVEKNYLDRFPGFFRKAGHRLATMKPNIIQNIVKRMKRTLTSKIVTSSPEIANMLKQPLELLEIPEDFHFFTKPLNHQMIALRYLYTHGQAGLLLDPGLGKTKIVLDYIALMGFGKSIIVCPKALLFVWEDETLKHRPDKKIYVLKSTGWDEQLKSAKTRMDKYEDIMNYLEEGSDEWKRARTNYLSAKRKVASIPDEEAEDLAKAKTADIIVVNYDKASNGYEYLQKHFVFDFIALDEALIKSHDSLRTKRMLELGSKIPYRTIMSGTLINNSALDAFAPIRFLNPSLVGSAYGRFEFYYAAYAKTRDNKQFVVGISQKNTVEIKEILEACCVVMRKEEWLDLPPKQFHPVISESAPEQKELFESLRSNMIADVGTNYRVEIDNPLSMMIKLSQISNGFLYLYENTGESRDYISDLFGSQEASTAPTEAPVAQVRETYYFESQPKLEAFRGLLEGSLNYRKAIIWYNCTAELHLIKRLLEEQHRTFLVIKGGTKNTKEVVDGFNRGNQYQFLICQARAVNYGITVLGDKEMDSDNVEVFADIGTEVYTHVFYSLNYSLEIFIQQQDRSHRIGQVNPVDYYILLTDCPADLAIYDALQAKVNIRESTLVDISKRIIRGY